MDDFIAVIVLYKTALDRCTTLNSLRTALKSTTSKLDVVIYDNSPNYQEVKEDFYPGLSITYVSDLQNSGVSKAYNVGYTIAVEKKKKWMILLDQDTDLPVDAFTKYTKAIAENSNQVLFAPLMLTPDQKIISPCDFKFMRGSYAKNYTYGINSLKGRSLINSGLCIATHAFSKNNGYNERIKLDYSDHDFIRRFSVHVTDSFVLVELKVMHQLSTDTSNTFESDKTRFDYYLEGSRYFQFNFSSFFFLKSNNLLRAAKLSVLHKSTYFIKKYFKYIVS